MEDPSASIMIRNKNNTWIEDSLVSNCYGCKKEFTWLLRKHHCRNCGNIFCYKCTDQTIAIPDFITDRPDPADYWNMSYYMTSLKGKEEKVCGKCFRTIVEKINVHDKIISVLKNPPPIEKMKELSDLSADIKDHYNDHLRNIQYYLPNHSYSEIDQKILRANSHHFGSHSKYLMHFIKSINWNLATVEDQNI